MPEHYARVELAGRGAVARLPYQVGLRSRHPILVPSVPGNHSTPNHSSRARVELSPSELLSGDLRTLEREW